MHLSDDKKPLDFKAKPPVSIYLDDEKADYKPGCCVVDISFPEAVTINEIRFRNSYTAFVSIMCKRLTAEKDIKNRDILPWQASINRFLLMPDPDCEQSAQDIFSISSTESNISWSGILNMRFILKQPSFRWKKFNLDELAFYGEITKLSDYKQNSASYSGSVSRRPDFKASVTDLDKTDAPLSPKTRYAWTISELIRDKQSIGSAIGRFEIVTPPNVDAEQD